MRILILVFACFMVSTAGNSKVELDFLNDLRESKYAVLSKHLAGQVELCIDDEQDVYPKQEVVRRIRSFFKKKKITKFKVLHKGKSSDDKSSYRVARITTPNGIYRIFAYSEGNSIREVRIDTMR